MNDNAHSGLKSEYHFSIPSKTEQKCYAFLQNEYCTAFSAASAAVCRYAAARICAVAHIRGKIV
jgi:hypothetical protein